MKHIFRTIPFFVFFVVGVSIVTAQSTCPAIVSEALTYLNRACSRIGRNQACYGNLTLTAQPQPGVTDLHFAAPGDIEAITRIHSLTLASMNEAVPEWGVSLMSLQASLPGTLPGQNVAFLLFGNTQLTRDDGTAASAGYGNGMQAFTFTSGIGDAHCGEAPDSGMLIQTNRGGAQVVFTVNGVQIWLGSTAYIESAPGAGMFIYIIEGKATVSALGVSRIVPAGTVVIVPTGGDGRAAGPPSEPQGYNMGIVGRLASTLSALPRRISISPTLDLSVCTLIPPANANTRQEPAITAQRSGRLTASVPQQATGTTTAADGTRWYQLTAGTWVREDAVNAFGPCAALSVVVQQPAAGSDNGAQTWQVIQTMTFNTCDTTASNRFPVGQVQTNTVKFTYSEDRSQLIWHWGDIEPVIFARVADNVYVKDYGNQTTWTLTFTSPTTLTGAFRSDPGCSFHYDNVGTLVG
jgi:hypothetical protein